MVKIPTKIVNTVEEYVILEKEYGMPIYHNKILDETMKLILSKGRKVHNLRVNKIIYESKNIIERLVLSLLDSSSDKQKKYLYKVQLTDKNDIYHNEFIKKALEEYHQIIFDKYIPNHTQSAVSKFNDEFIDIIINNNKEYTNYITNYIESVTKLKALPKNIDDVIKIIETDTKIRVIYKDYTKDISHSRYKLIHTNHKSITPVAFMRMILRYGLTKDSGQQWSLGLNLYHYIAKILNVNTEMFGSPLNFLLKYFCSLHPDTDADMGSLGNYFELLKNKTFLENSTNGLYCPPYVEKLMDDGSLYLNDIFSKFENEQKAYVVVCFVPEWTDADYMNTMKNSKYNVIDKKLLRGEYIHSKKSIGKKMLVTALDSHCFLMHSLNKDLSKKDREELEDKFRKIVRFLRREADDMKRKTKKRIY